MSSAHTLSPLTVPADFAKAPPAYRFRVWMAMLGLLLFVVLYVGLAGWFTYTAYRMIAGVFAGGEGAAAAFFAALPSAFLAIFMWKALFFVRRGADSPGLEITAADQPELFQFLNELADQVGAPRPHRVFLSPTVNAAVFYDLSILNFFIPSKKNLIIGLGLVNALNRSEFKAVLAHEFGHFAQRSMAVGRWVYIGEQIAAHIIAKRDALDRTLDFISSIDIRIAWIGWIMRTVVWSIRSLMESVFRWVVIAHRALSREMEFQADLVAVSVTGSDALVHGLYRLQPADEDLERSLSFVNTQLAKGRFVTDLFAVQTRIAEHMRRVLNEPTHGKVPASSDGSAADRRLFTEEIAQPPRMWSTHPPNTEREANAKRVYIPAPADDASAWTLFEHPQELRERVTNLLYDGVVLEKEPELLSAEETEAAVDELYSHESYDTRYRGAYLGRHVTIPYADVLQAYAPLPSENELGDALRNLYPESLHDTLTEWRNLAEEVAMLEAIEEGVYDASGGVIRHRGKVIPRAQLPQLIADVKQERDAALAKIEDHDRKCRAAHAAAAQRAAVGWHDYLSSLTRLLHYAEHSEADLNDAHGRLANVTAVATAAGRVNAEKLRRIITAANDLQTVMARLDTQTTGVELPPAVLRELDVEKWRDAVDKLELPPANKANVNQWMQVVDSWVVPMTASFGRLRKAALAELLRSERYVAEVYRGEREAEPAPPPAKVPADYGVRPRGTERPRQTKLDWWVRFTRADGIGPGAARFVVASAIVAAVVVAGLFVGSAGVVVYNGLSRPVNVSLNDREVTVGPFQHQTVSVGSGWYCSVVARTSDGREIESFDARLDKAFANYVYNVAGAAAMVEWDVVYEEFPQPGREPQPEFLGFPRWRITSAYYILEQPPQQIEMSSPKVTRTVLDALPELHPYLLLQGLDDSAEKEKERVIRTHATWDAADARFTQYWLALASKQNGFDAILSQRLHADPGEVLSLRFQQENALPENKDAILARHREEAARHPEDPDWQYVGIRAMPDGPEQDQAYLDAVNRWPDNVWMQLAVAYVYARRQEWDMALKAYEKCLSRQGPSFDIAAIQVARIRRLLAGDKPPDLNDLQNSFEVNQLISLETGKDMQGMPVFAYSLLNQGKLEEAERTAGGDQADVNLKVLLAASNGAKPQWQERGLNVPVAGVEDSRLLFYLAALAYRNRRPYEPYLQAAAKEFTDTHKSPLEVVRAIFDRGAPGESLDDELIGLDPASQGLVLATALVAFPEQAKPEWRRKANALLFVFERPWL